MEGAMIDSISIQGHRSHDHYYRSLTHCHQETTLTISPSIVDSWMTSPCFSLNYRISNVAHSVRSVWPISGTCVTTAGPMFLRTGTFRPLLSRSLLLTTSSRVSAHTIHPTYTSISQILERTKMSVIYSLSVLPSAFYWDPRRQSFTLFRPFHCHRLTTIGSSSTSCLVINDSG